MELVIHSHKSSDATDDPFQIRQVMKKTMNTMEVNAIIPRLSGMPAMLKLALCRHGGFQ